MKLDILRNVRYTCVEKISRSVSCPFPQLALFNRQSRQTVREYPYYATFGNAMEVLMSDSEEEPG